ncbi:10464_t:CDS:1 [Funneliformis geosporum]|uniref:8700_t:CDS:1 n=1 Tax=Funneliformis geosporum TaxID=1117311 RepID=A0A9W4WXW6_9GLOM|nr:10464_t:CDS:1 [Funneliformis geosporum]CAI2187329.1 8700_t:CDS:1 [Funneliformis geosporum]
MKFSGFYSRQGILDILRDFHNIRINRNTKRFLPSIDPYFTNKIRFCKYIKRQESFSFASSIRNLSSLKAMENLAEPVKDATIASEIVEEVIKIETTNPEGQTQYRLRIKNIPKFASIKMMKDLLANHECGQVKIQKSPKWDYCFAILKTEEQQLDVMSKLKGIEFKNKRLFVQIDNVTERDRQALFDKRKNKKDQKIEQSGVQKLPEEMLADQVTPLHNYEYQAQIELKQNGIIKSLRTFCDKMKESYNDNKSNYNSSWLKEEFDFNLPFDLKPMIHSPILEGYRNKCEFTVGLNLEGEKTVGFLLGAYKDGLNTVLGPHDSIHVSDVAKKIVEVMQSYIEQSSYEVYDRRTKQGNWRLLTVRSQKCGDIMIIVQMHPQGLSKEQIIQEKSNLLEYFKSFAQEEKFNLTSLLVQMYDGLSNGISYKDPFDCLYGTPFVYEEMMNCKFRISPAAFFQTNTLAAELLYQKCGDIIKELYESKDLSESPTLIDMCCGTGTIGIVLSKNLGSTIKGVVGIELCEEAIEDAKINASLNGINNAKYILGPVEKNLSALNEFNYGTSGTAIAIVDPPRAGIHKNVINALRTCQAIEHLIYISCDHNAVVQNFMNICRPTSNAFPGIPFKPVKAVGVDLFPHAKHVELIIEFHRNRNELTNLPSTSSILQNNETE